MRPRKIPTVIAVFGLLLAAFYACAMSAQDHEQLTSLDPGYPPLAEENREALHKRLVQYFNLRYGQKLPPEKRDLADGYKIYFLRRELQALIDMYRATDEQNYLNTAKNIVHEAIYQAKANPKPLLRHGKTRGIWPCFYYSKLQKATGGHCQLDDFQGSTGFLMVARALKQAQMTGHAEITEFVEKNIVEKWLQYQPYQKSDYLGPDWPEYLMAALQGARDKREHFACICMDLHDLGASAYPYEKWAKLLTRLYLAERPCENSPLPENINIKRNVPNNWGVIKTSEYPGYVWRWTRNRIIQDTSHANRTVWLACKAYENNYIDRDRLTNFIKTLKSQIWAPEKAAFYFNNYIDGRDEPYSQMGRGRKGNVWFGWHRLAAYDQSLKDLFISMAYDLTNNAEGFPHLAQNVRMENAPLCLTAWAARLTAEEK